MGRDDKRTWYKGKDAEHEVQTKNYDLADGQARRREMNAYNWLVAGGGGGDVRNQAINSVGTEPCVA